MAGPKLEVRNVSKTFRGPTGAPMPVVEDLSLAVAPLEFVALLGPSGCGKSTLLRIIDGLIAADAGTVWLDGEDVTGTPGRGRGMVFQTFDLLPWRTALENVEFGLEVQGLAKAERRRLAQAYVELVGLAGFEHAYPYQLSGGMQQRIGIARAFAIRPEVLLMDEPFGALDVQTRDIMQDELLQIWDREQKTVLFVTHGIEEALYLADRIIVFSPRPARIVREFTVPFGRPRLEALKTDAGFQALRRDIWEILKQSTRPKGAA
ncbi:MAG TPA: ABC transporter ATP-binding protein [Candidatus Baltobacteraceae bacterium]|nr:ABC transporter ATP-binding protein [Candidatus Baltobacteraceae bacterium]